MSQGSAGADYDQDSDSSSCEETDESLEMETSYGKVFLNVDNPKIIYVVWRGKSSCGETHYDACYSHISDLTDEELDLFACLDLSSSFKVDYDRKQNFFRDLARGEFYYHFFLDEPRRITKRDLKELFICERVIELIAPDSISKSVLDCGSDIFEGISEYMYQLQSSY